LVVVRALVAAVTGRRAAGFVGAVLVFEGTYASRLRSRFRTGTLRGATAGHAPSWCTGKGAYTRLALAERHLAAPLHRRIDRVL
jgi:hypothetical protein